MEIKDLLKRIFDKPLTDKIYPNHNGKKELSDKNGILFQAKNQLTKMMNNPEINMQYFCKKKKKVLRGSLHCFTLQSMK